VKVQQVLLFVAALVLGSLLYFFGKTTEKHKTGKEQTTTASLPELSISFEEYEQQRLSTLQPNFIAALENAENDKVRSDIWLQYDSPALSAWYFYLHALDHADTASLKQAGDRLMTASRSQSDTAVSKNCITFALQSFERALEMAPGHPELTLRIAEIYVDASAEPMKGITMLMELSESQPDYIPAQIALGRFALVSGQYDKAKLRLDKVLQSEPGNTEAMYFLAFAEEGLGNNERAIVLLEQCKLLVDNPHFDREMDVYLNKLRNK
jgi:tetratricopeptide (TPR) repeat protein